MATQSTTVRDTQYLAEHRFGCGRECAIGITYNKTWSYDIQYVTEVNPRCLPRFWHRADEEGVSDVELSALPALDLVVSASRPLVVDGQHPSPSLSHSENCHPLVQRDTALRPQTDHAVAQVVAEQIALGLLY